MVTMTQLSLPDIVEVVIVEITNKYKGNYFSYDKSM